MPRVDFETNEGVHIQKVVESAINTKNGCIGDCAVIIEMPRNKRMVIGNGLIVMMAAVRGIKSQHGMNSRGHWKVAKVDERWCSNSVFCTEKSFCIRFACSEFPMFHSIEFAIMFRVRQTLC